ncbi:MAG: hypothetical protein ABFC90_03795 [Bacteroidales bacterium]|nr:hypothetical protein [Bacteroidales bacterium]MDD2612435.1 hypothetical protein [Bacteroidales bacterium]MDD3907319.1 hypothetical protein [Bacteroidales bacterium]MDD4713033.1 hypothetical protein [Bacteroidales bacterium]
MEKDRSTHHQNNMESSNRHPRPYRTPDLQCIRLDSDISLALESTPEYPGSEPWIGKAEDSFSNDPFKTNLG